MTCDVRLQLAEVRCACETHFESHLRCACVRYILKLAKCDLNIAHYFGNNERTLLSFGLSYDFVAQKWRILANFSQNKPIFGKLLGRYWDLKQCLKAKILN